MNIVLAGPPEERFGGLEDYLTASGESFIRLGLELTDPRFTESIGDEFPSLVVARFHEGDLASIKAMQSFRLKQPCTQFIFLSSKEIAPSILTLMFNEGAFGILKEPLSPDSALLLARQAIKKSRWDLEDLARSQELIQINSSLQKRVDQLETAQSRSKELVDKLERMINQTLSDKLFKASAVKVMLVSASDYQRGLLSEDIKKAGFTMETCKDGQEALAMLKKTRPAIVVSDLELDDMTGVELAEAMKREAPGANVYFVVITSSPERIGQILQPGTKVDDCVMKPTSAMGHYQLVARIALGALRR